MKIILLSRHVAVQDWLHRHHPEVVSEVVERGTMRPEDVESSDVLVGVVPLGLAARAAAALVVEFAAPPRGAELTVADMEAAGARLVAYRVVPADPAGVLAEFAQARAGKQARVDGLTGVIARGEAVAGAVNPERGVPGTLLIPGIGPRP